MKRILGHQEDAEGNLVFLTQKDGEDEQSAEYLVPKDFLSEAGQKFVQYCERTGLQDLLGLFQRPVEE